jgi:hypothetical protein
MTNLIIARGTAVTLNGNKLSGNTYPAKDYIKSYLGGKWDGATKTWIVDVEKVNNLIARQAIRVDDSAPAAVAPKAFASGWCNKCKSYCYGDCES